MAALAIDLVKHLFQGTGSGIIRRIIDRVAMAQAAQVAQVAMFMNTMVVATTMWATWPT